MNERRAGYKDMQPIPDYLRAHIHEGCFHLFLFGGNAPDFPWVDAAFERLGVVYSTRNVIYGRYWRISVENAAKTMDYSCGHLGGLSNRPIIRGHGAAEGHQFLLGELAKDLEFFQEGAKEPWVFHGPVS